MNILVAAAWMWMAAQGTQPPHRVGDWVRVPAATQRGITAIYEYSPVPAEHVIEIRTKRRPTGKVRACYYLTTGQQVGDPCEIIEKPTYCPSGANCQDLYNETREIWIDGKEWGVLKESGQ